MNGIEYYPLREAEMNIWIFTRLTYVKGVGLSQWVALVTAHTMKRAFMMLDLPVDASADGRMMGPTQDSRERVVFAGFNTAPL
jgi:hypothetical protein